MNITIRTAEKSDIETLVRFRFMYMTDVEGELSETQINALNSQLPEYFEKHIGQDFTAYLAEDNGKAVSVIFMVRLEKPASVHFLSGSTCYLMNVYTDSEYRRLGIASQILDRLIADAKSEGITCIDLSATEMGKHVYLKKGFIERGNTEMRMEL
ncbi:MAG: GNAT family N-acetyltransferase [Oscillospiraceae bacterium]|nr:GNAT family N-acetyltransferase [Oscillospiraceae bacterium]